MIYKRLFLVLNLLVIYSISLADDEWFEVELSIQPLVRSFEGQIEAINQATVSSQTSGRVAEIHYDVDDFVPAGSVLIEFTNTEQKQAVKKAQANLEFAKAIEKAFPCNRCGISVIGLEVPHAHLHLVPINSADDLNFSRPKLQLTTAELKAVQLAILAELK